MNSLSALSPLLIPVIANQNRPARGACTRKLPLRTRCTVSTTSEDIT